MTGGPAIEARLPSPAFGLFLQVQQAIQTCNALAEGLLGRGEIVFPPNSLARVRVPVLAESELAFIKTVSWMYAEFVEVGGSDLRFLQSRFSGYAIHVGVGPVLELIRVLRTYQQHNLNYTSNRDVAVADACVQWSRDSCGTAVPTAPADFQRCLEVLLLTGLELAQACEACLRKIEADPERSIVIDAWRRQRRLDVRPEEFDELISLVAIDLGMAQVDAIKLRRRFFDQWKGRLGLLSDSVDIRVECRKLIEDALLKMEFLLPPITGGDITGMGVPPGPRVGELLRFAKRLQESGVRDREEVLRRVAQEARGGAL